LRRSKVANAEPTTTLDGTPSSSPSGPGVTTRGSGNGEVTTLTTGFSGSPSSGSTNCTIGGAGSTCTESNRKGMKFNWKPFNSTLLGKPS
jgi:hypothetical protein